MQRIVRESTVGNELGEIFRNNQGKDIIIFGAGELGKWVYDCFWGKPWFKVKCFVDSNRGGEEYGELPIIFLDQYKEIQEALICVCSWVFHEEQCRQLRELSIPDENIVDVVELMYEVRNTKQYFELPELNVCKGEVFIDGGRFDGVNSLQFVKWCEGNFQKVYAFEPDEDNYLECVQKLKDFLADKKIELINKGLGKDNKIQSFSRGGSGSRFMAGGKDFVEVVALDEIVEEKISFLKLDIEGAERMAIHGAKNHIQKDKPKCAICVYHKPEDIWEIPMLLLEYNPDYRLFLRHYSFNENETVLYAI